MKKPQPLTPHERLLLIELELSAGAGRATFIGRARPGSDAAAREQRTLATLEAGGHIILERRTGRRRFYLTAAGTLTNWITDPSDIRKSA